MNKLDLRGYKNLTSLGFIQERLKPFENQSKDNVTLVKAHLF